MVSRVAVIPARGGSKRIPQKNIVPIHGKPMIAYTIEAAIKSHAFDMVVVSTDCEKIAAVAMQYGAEVPFLRTEKADDHSPVSEATLSCVNELESQLGLKFDEVMQLMPNCPNRDQDDINAMIEFYERTNSSSVVSCFKFGWMNPWWALQLDKSFQGEKLFPQALKTRSQDLPDLHCPTGAVWFGSVDSLRKHNSFYTPEVTYFEMTWQNAVDIDDQEDLQMAELLMARKFGVDRLKGSQAD